MIAAFAPSRNTNKRGTPPRIRLPEIIPPVAAQTSIDPAIFPRDPHSRTGSSLSFFFKKNSTIKNPARKLPHTIEDGKSAPLHIRTIPSPINTKDETKEGSMDLTLWRR